MSIVVGAECRCDCHDPEGFGTMHIMPCCIQCQWCSTRIDFGWHDQHKQECKERWWASIQSALTVECIYDPDQDTLLLTKKGYRPTTKVVSVPTPGDTGVLAYMDLAGSCSDDPVMFLVPNPVKADLRVLKTLVPVEFFQTVAVWVCWSTDQNPYQTLTDLG